MRPVEPARCGIVLLTILLGTSCRTGPESRGVAEAELRQSALDQAASTHAPPQSRPSAVLDGHKVTLQPSGIVFTVPPSWIEWKSHFDNNFHLTTGQLDKVEHGAGEWDTEYGKIANAALPFDRCAVHAGGEGWGADAWGYGDLQFRVYILDGIPERIEESIYKKSKTAAAALERDSRSVFRAKATAEDKTSSGWTKSVGVTMSVSYFDYGGAANVDFWLFPWNEQTVVAVFMYSKYQVQESTIESVLQSFLWP